MFDERRLRAIAFVARRFDSLQGFHLVVYGLALTAGALMWSVLPDATANVWGPVILTAQTAQVSLALSITLYYRERFGRTSKPTNTPQFRGGAGGVVALLTMSALFDVGVSFPGGRPSAMSATWAVICLWMLVRDWPQRPHLLLGVFGGVVGMVVSGWSPTPPGELMRLDPAVAGYFVISTGIVALSLVACGLLDHAVLTRVMEPSAVTSSMDLPRKWRRMRTIFAGLLFTALAIVIVGAGWPLASYGLQSVILLTTCAFILAAAVDDTRAWIRGDGSRHQWVPFAYSELTRAREARFFERLFETAADPDREQVHVDAHRSATTEPDAWMLIPVACAAGALVDVIARGHGLPSGAAIGVALYYARAMWRGPRSDMWAVLPCTAASAASLLHMSLGQVDPARWLVLSILLVTGAMFSHGVVEALSDRLKDPEHADAL